MNKKTLPWFAKLMITLTLRSQKSYAKNYIFVTSFIVSVVVRANIKGECRR